MDLSPLSKNLTQIICVGEQSDLLRTVLKVLYRLRYAQYVMGRVPYQLEICYRTEKNVILALGKGSCVDNLPCAQRRKLTSRALSESTDKSTWMNARTKTALRQRYPATLVRNHTGGALFGRIVTTSRARQV
jgi:uncharacterized protein (UPF0303 family)